MKTDLSQYNNSWYKPGSIFKRVIWYFVSAIFFQGSLSLPSVLKVVLLRIFGAKIGVGIVIKPRVTIKYPWKLTIGNYCWVGENVWIDNLDDVVIGDNVCISQGAMLICGNHNYKKPQFDLMIAPIILKEGSWVGARSTVGPGVTLNSHTVLTLGSIATNDLDAYGIYSGNPAQKIKARKIANDK